MSGTVPGTAVPWNSVLEAAAASGSIAAGSIADGVAREVAEVSGALAGTSAGEIAGGLAATLLRRDTGRVLSATPAYIRAAGSLWTPKDFAKNGGTPGWHDNPAVADDSEALDELLKSGERGDVYGGDFYIREKRGTMGMLENIGQANVEWNLSADSTIRVMPEIGLSPGSLFKLYGTPDGSPDPTRPSKFVMRGGRLDFTALVGTAILTSGIDMFSYNDWTIEDVIFDCGTSPASTANPGFGQGDTGITMHNCGPGSMRACTFRGWQDCGVYLSGANSSIIGPDGKGEYAKLAFNHFEYCGNAVASKRAFYALQALINTIRNCKNGILASPADSPRQNNHGKVLIAIGNILDEMEGFGIRCVGGYGNLIQANRSTDWGVRKFDKKYVGVSSGNYIAAISLSGATDSLVDGNILRGHENLIPIEAPIADRQPHGIVIETNTWVAESPVHSVGNTIGRNQISDIERAILEENANCNFNIYEFNTEKRVLLPSIVRGPNSKIYRHSDLDETVQLFTDVKLRGEQGDPALQTLGEVLYRQRGRGVGFSCRIELASAVGISGPIYIDLPDAMPLAAREWPLIINAGGMNNSSDAYTRFEAVLGRNTRRITIFEGGTGVRKRVTGSQVTDSISLTIGDGYTAAFTG